MLKYKVKDIEMEIIKGNIVGYNADAIVIPANPDLDCAGFGVQASILEYGGREIFDEASKIADEYVRKHGSIDIHGKKGKVPIYSAHLTTGGSLPAKYVIHSVALNFNPESSLYCNEKIIAESTKNVLELGKAHKLTSIGFPALGTGVYNVSLENSIKAIIGGLKKHLEEETCLKRLGIILYNNELDLKDLSLEELLSP
jgi:O-acetyl-ADP-ribose deacetylase (regulator of RNase III)